LRPIKREWEAGWVCRNRRSAFVTVPAIAAFAVPRSVGRENAAQAEP